MHIQDHIKAAQKILNSYWPLNAFIATNSLWNYRDTNFFELANHIPCQYLPSEAQYRQLLDSDENSSMYYTTPTNHYIELYSEQIGTYHYQQATVWIQEKLFTIILSYFKNKSDCINHTWQAYEKDQVPTTDSYDEFISHTFTELGIENNKLTVYMQKIYTYIYGWSSLSYWLEATPNNPWLNKPSILNDILVMWLFYECIIRKKTNAEYVNRTPQRISDKYLNIARHNQRQIEINYITPITQELGKNPKRIKTCADAQLVFCIDTRSEGLRRQLESLGNYETYGMAGFFGITFELQAQQSSYQSPALIRPDNIVTQNPTKQLLLHLSALHANNAMSQTKSKILAPFAQFEILGAYYLFYMLYKQIKPGIRSTHSTQQSSNFNNTFNIDQKLACSTNFIESIDLCNFASDVVICGHQSDTTNNPYQSSLNCGACGGNSGIPNATLICSFLNDSEIRRLLKQRHDIDIPMSTTFHPAIHHTVNDRIDFIDTKPRQKVIDDLAMACTNLRREKATDYPFLSQPHLYEHIWSELTPELGLINNACFIIGPRYLSAHLNLKRRAFLHSYNPSKDTDARILTNILSGPGVVAHWINIQYFLSTNNPLLFSAGNKATHNVLPGIGVIEGNLSDLKIGLPQQSLVFKDKILHEPLRLTVLVYAHSYQIESALQSSPDFKKLVDNEWLNLIQLPVNKNDNN